MNTLFECWNAGVVEWDGLSPPRLSFSYLLPSHEALAFFLLSARISQLMSKQEWQLSFAGHSYAVPHFPSTEIGWLMGQFQTRFGYRPVLRKSLSAGKNSDGGELFNLQWVHMASGSVNSYAPFVGRRSSIKHYRRAGGVVVACCEQLAVQFEKNGALKGEGDRALIERLNLFPAASGQIAKMLQQYFRTQHPSLCVKP